MSEILFEDAPKLGAYYRKGSFLSNAVNVLWVTLNTGERAIIEGKNIHYEKTLTWGLSKNYKYTFNDCKGSLLFMDGFDEFIDEAKHSTYIKDIVVFLEIYCN